MTQMKFFTRKFIHGGLDEAGRLRAITEYECQLQSPALWPVSETLGRLNLHDARVLSFMFNKRKESLTLRVRRGELRTGYFDTSLILSQVKAGEKSLQLLRKSSHDSAFEILATELETAKDAFRFRVLFWPKGEASILFKGVRITSTAVTKR